MRDAASRVLTLIAVCALILTGCSGPKLPTRPAELVGVITESTEGSGGVRILVVKAPGQTETSSLDAGYMAITPEAALFDAEGKPLEAGALKVRDTVRLWTTGAVAESYPVQGTAEAVQVTGQFSATKDLPLPPGLEGITP